MATIKVRKLSIFRSHSLRKSKQKNSKRSKISNNRKVRKMKMIESNKIKVFNK